MKHISMLVAILRLSIAATLLATGTGTARAQDEKPEKTEKPEKVEKPAKPKKTDRTWTVPILMEMATVRGKVVVLETRRDDRKVIENLRVEVWTAPEDDKEERLIETQTDANGFFDLPLLKVGDYRLIVGELTLNLTVVPKAAARQGQPEEPKTLLILLPKEVV